MIHRSLLCPVALAALSVCFGAQAESGIKLTSDEAREFLAAKIAQSTGQTVAAARSSMKFGNASVSVMPGIRKEFSSRFAGAFKERPDLLVIRLTGQSMIPTRLIQADGEVLTVEFRPGATHTNAQLLAIFSRNIQKLSLVDPGAVAYYLDERSGEIVLQTQTLTNDQRTRVPQDLEGVRVRHEEYEGLKVTRSALIGGSSALDCTTGFAVRSRVGRKGITTSAHCSDIQTVTDAINNEIELVNVVVEHNNSRNDIQIMEGYVAPTAGEIYIGESFTIPITGQINRFNIPIGEGVCHYGKTTGLSCGTVGSTTWGTDGNNPYPLCTSNTEYCEPIWVAVLGGTDSDLSCGGGDSGGPFFLESSALGSMTFSIEWASASNPCLAAIYLGIERISAIGYNLML